MKQSETKSDDNELTYECPCGGQSFGLVVTDGAVAYARCRVCNEVVLNG